MNEFIRRDLSVTVIFEFVGSVFQDPEIYTISDYYEHISINFNDAITILVFKNILNYWGVKRTFMISEH